MIVLCKSRYRIGAGSMGDWRRTMVYDDCTCWYVQPREWKLERARTGAAGKIIAAPNQLLAGAQLPLTSNAARTNDEEEYNRHGACPGPGILRAKHPPARNQNQTSQLGWGRGGFKVRGVQF